MIANTHKKARRIAPVTGFHLAEVGRSVPCHCCGVAIAKGIRHVASRDRDGYVVRFHRACFDASMVTVTTSIAG